MALADYLAHVRRPGYGNPGSRLSRAPALILATVAFGWQIYFDFSGYTDMARGIAQMMGFRLMLNFNNPYTATGPGRLLEPLAHQPVDLVQGLCLLPAGRQPRRHVANVSQHVPDDGDLRRLARGGTGASSSGAPCMPLGRCLTRELEQTSFYQTARAEVCQADAGLRVRDVHLDFLPGHGVKTWPPMRSNLSMSARPWRL